MPKLEKEVMRSLRLDSLAWARGKTTDKHSKVFCFVLDPWGAHQWSTLITSCTQMIPGSVVAYTRYIVTTPTGSRKDITQKILNQKVDFDFFRYCNVISFCFLDVRGEYHRRAVVTPATGPFPGSVV